MSLSEIEINYTPSKWSKRYGDVELLAYFHKFASEISTTARKTTKCILNVSYGNTERTKYDIYGSDLPKDAPIFVFIHGGYWQEFSKEFAAFAVPVFVASGIKVIIVGYDLCPNVRLGDIVSQIKGAIKQILESVSNSGARNVWISGHSAGAHLAVSLLFDKSWLDELRTGGVLHLLKGIVLISGIYKLGPLLDTSFNEALKLSKEEIDTYSFSTLEIKNVEPIQGLKVIVTVGECDSPIFINESRECAQKLITMVDNVQYVLLRENVDHFDIVERLMDKSFALTKLILDNMSS